MFLAGLVAFARCRRPDPIPNSAVKRLSAHGTVSQDPGESVAARPAKNKRVKPKPNPAPAGQPASQTPIHSSHLPSLITDPRSMVTDIGAGWSSPVARQAHNLKAAGSNPAPATNDSCEASAEAAAALDPDPNASMAASCPRTSICGDPFSPAGQGTRRTSSIKPLTCSRAAAASSSKAASRAADPPVRRYSSGRFGIGRGGRRDARANSLPGSARGRRVRPSSPSTGRQARPSRPHPSRPGCRSSPVRVRGDCSSARRRARPAACSTLHEAGQETSHLNWERTPASSSSSKHLSRSTERIKRFPPNRGTITVECHTIEGWPPSG